MLQAAIFLGGKSHTIYAAAQVTKQNCEPRLREESIRAQRICLAIALALSTLAGAFASDQFVHPDLKGGKVLVHTVLILAPGALVKRFGSVLGGEVMPEEGKQLQVSLRASAGKVLVEKGCQSLVDPYTQEALDKDPAAKSSLTEVEARYRSLEPQIWKKPKDVRLGRFTLGDGVAKLNPGHTIDAFVFMGAFGSLATNSEKVKRILGGPGNASHDAVDIQISIVDARTGTVLYFGKKITSGNFITDPQHVEHGLEAALEDFNCGRILRNSASDLSRVAHAFLVQFPARRRDAPL